MPNDYSLVLLYARAYIILINRNLYLYLYFVENVMLHQQQDIRAPDICKSLFLKAIHVIRILE